MDGRDSRAAKHIALFTELAQQYTQGNRPLRCLIGQGFSIQSHIFCGECRHSGQCLENRFESGALIQE
jgi:hypothetical protein